MLVIRVFVVKVVRVRTFVKVNKCGISRWRTKGLRQSSDILRMSNSGTTHRARIRESQRTVDGWEVTSDLLAIPGIRGVYNRNQFYYLMSVV